VVGNVRKLSSYLTINFLKLVWDDLPKDNRKSVHFFRIAETNTGIGEWNIEEAVKARYKADIETLNRYYSSKEGNPERCRAKNSPCLRGVLQKPLPNTF